MSFGDFQKIPKTMIISKDQLRLSDKNIRVALKVVLAENKVQWKLANLEQTESMNVRRGVTVGRKGLLYKEITLVINFPESVGHH